MSHNSKFKNVLLLLLLLGIPLIVASFQPGSRAPLKAVTMDASLAGDGIDLAWSSGEGEPPSNIDEEVEQQFTTPLIGDSGDTVQGSHDDSADQAAVLQSEESDAGQSDIDSSSDVHAASAESASSDDSEVSANSEVVVATANVSADDQENGPDVDSANHSDDAVHETADRAAEEESAPVDGGEPDEQMVKWQQTVDTQIRDAGAAQLSSMIEAINEERSSFEQRVDPLIEQIRGLEAELNQVQHQLNSLDTKLEFLSQRKAQLSDWPAE